MRKFFSNIFKFLFVAPVVLAGCGKGAVPEELKIPELPSVKAVADGCSIVLTAEFKSDDEAAAVKDYGFYFGADAGTLERVRVTDIDGLGYSLVKEGLEYSCAYYFKAWISNGRDELASELQSVTTADAPLPPDPPADKIVLFKDPAVKSICVANWDSDGDGELSLDEASGVRDIGSVFEGNAEIRYFDEFECFTGVESIPDCAFSDCVNLETIKLPESLTTLGRWVFRRCFNMNMESLPSSMRVIGEGAFEKCSRISWESLPEGIERIDQGAFCDCTNLRLTELPSKLSAVYLNTFLRCEELRLTELPSGITFIGSSAFYGARNITLKSLPSGVKIIEYDAFLDCSSLRLDKLPDSLYDIGSTAFLNCGQLNITELPSKLREVREGTFAYCVGIKSLDLPSGLIRIRSNAFEGCQFEKITIPGKVECIDTDAFAGCYWLSSVTILAETPPEMYDVNLGSYSDEIYVPASSLEEYRSASGWSRWKDKFKPIVSE